MTANFQQKELVEFTGLVSVDKDGFPKVYASRMIAERAAAKSNANVTPRKRGFLVTK